MSFGQTCLRIYLDVLFGASNQVLDSFGAVEEIIHNFSCWFCDVDMASQVLI